MSETKMLQVPLPLHLFRALRQHCAYTDSTLRETVNGLVIELLSNPRYAQGNPMINPDGSLTEEAAKSMAPRNYRIKS